MADPYDFHCGFMVFRIPDYMIEGIRDYVERGIRPGSFLEAVFANDLVTACSQADENNMTVLPAYAAYLHNEAPRNCWGSREVVEAWIQGHEEARKVKKVE